MPGADLNLWPDEFRRLAEACRWIRITACPLKELRAFLIGRLEGSHAPLAAKVQGYSDEQMRELCEALRERQAQTREVPAPR